MKKVLFFLLCAIILTSAVWAAPAKNVVAKESAVYTDTSNVGKFYIGDWSGWGVLGYNINRDFSAALGTYYVSTGSVYGLLLKGDYNLAKVGKIQPSVGLSYNTSSTGASGTITLNYGVRTPIAEALEVGFDIFFLSYTGTGGSNSTTILPGAVFKGQLGL
ncbi:hypothetical protein COT42_08490 [Candidatus Saganbacteria bacterium CG08_land_8_20_14_0_20_45_16]|uniref:Outer membrane protein beta-barrel domain-containing protein n=1 Tax=Candidatus Saganbacteria bacterium CG08_land_8_20_14_0_20_45_16 TaxID=2014293 RepID=A0A2H0XTN4_UNCSA|nr:MAG: hypothetical protein COT42_08490 [Candidatus Saganbacteria bacterium CG08_land_8_20_14_0_20_45_16]